MSQLSIGSLFSGIGGLELGIERATGGRVVWQAESNPYCREVLARHWPEATRYADVRDIGSGVERVDIICGGFPCTDISVAGKGIGITGPQSGLWSEYARIVGELRPRVVVVENVAALLGRGLGRVLGDLSALGYDAWWDCIPAAAVGAPHRRDRLFVVARRVVADPVGEGFTGSAGRATATRRPNTERSSDAVADADGARRREGGTGRKARSRTVAGRARQGAMADANSARELQPQGRVTGERGRVEHSGDWPPSPDDMHAWGAVPADAQPAFCKLAHGVSPLVARRRQRLTALGNAVVPQCVEALAPVIKMALAEAARVAS